MIKFWIAGVFWAVTSAVLADSNTDARNMNVDMEELDIILNSLRGVVDNDILGDGKTPFDIKSVGSYKCIGVKGVESDNGKPEQGMKLHMVKCANFQSHKWVRTDKGYLSNAKNRDVCLDSNDGKSLVLTACNTSKPKVTGKSRQRLEIRPLRRPLCIALLGSELVLENCELGEVRQKWIDWR